MQENSLIKSKIKQNILFVIESKGITKYKFYQLTGITRGVLDQNNGLSEENTAKFLAYFTDIDANWLISGIGNMTKSEHKEPEPAFQEPDVGYNKQCQACAEKERIIEAKNELIAAKNETIESLKQVIQQTTNEPLSKRNAS